MDCPKCLGKLERMNAGDKKKPIFIDKCFACGGIWFDDGELIQTINKEIIDTVETKIDSKHLPKDIAEDFDKKDINCLKCGKKMQKVLSRRNKKVTIDYCDICQSIWLDGGEFEDVGKRNKMESFIERVLDCVRLFEPQDLKYMFKQNRGK